MEQALKKLIEQNRIWSQGVRDADPDFFRRLAAQQSPEYMWIGCADSRVPANEILGLAPGEVFVHRNVANVVVHTDLNCLSVLQFAVDVLKVKHILIVGHYGCGGVNAAMNDIRVGLADNWLRHVKDVRDKYRHPLMALEPAQRSEKLCELNVLEQVLNLCETTVLQDAWDRGQQVAVHGWIYGLADGVLHDLHMAISHHDQLLDGYTAAVERLLR